MNLSKTITGTILATALVLVSCGPSPDELRMADEWLNTDCVTATGDSITDAIRATGTDLETTFIGAFTLGPPAASLASIDSAGARLYAIAAAAIDTTDAARFPDGAAFLATSSTSFAASYVRAHDRAYRSRALAALGVIGSNPAKAIIDTVAVTTGSDFYRQALAIRAELLATGSYRIK